MSSTLESLPHEILLAISTFVIQPNGLQVGLHFDPFDAKHEAYVLPVLQDFTSLQLTSRGLYGPATEAYRERNTLSVNICDAQRPPIFRYPRPTQRPVNLPGPSISDNVFENFNKLELVLPFNLSRGHNMSRGHIRGPLTDVLMRCYMKFSRPQRGGEWTCHFIDVQRVNEDEGWNFTESSLQDAAEHIKEHAPRLACRGLNREAVGGRFPDMPPIGESKPINSTNSLTSQRLVMAIMYDFDMLPNRGHPHYGLFRINRPLDSYSRRGWEWRVAPAWGYDDDFNLNNLHLSRPHYSNNDEAMMENPLQYLWRVYRIFRFFNPFWLLRRRFYNFIFFHLPFLRFLESKWIMVPLLIVFTVRNLITMWEILAILIARYT